MVGCLTDPGSGCQPGHGGPIQSVHEPPCASACCTRKPKDVSVHGDTRIDDYFWLRERDDPEVLAHLKAENDHAEAWFAPHKGFQDALYAEILGRIQEDDEAVPYRKGEWWYATRTSKGLQYPVHVRRRGAPDGPEQVLIDLNELAKDKPFLQLGVLAVSPDARLLAYSLDETGALDFTLCVKDLDTGAALPVRIEKTDAAVWANDNATLFYLTKDEAKRTARVWRHTIGQQGPDTLVWEERNELFWVSLSKTLDRRYIVIGSDSKDTSELRVIDADRPAHASASCCRAARAARRRWSTATAASICWSTTPGPTFASSACRPPSRIWAARQS
jgi:oligopeptidase B